MPRVDLGHIRVRRPGRLERLALHTPALLLGLFVLAWLVLWLGRWLPGLPFARASWSYGLLLALALATLAAGLTRQLPAQSVFLACMLLLVAGASLHLLNLATGIPLGVRVANEPIRRQLFWILPMTWATMLLACRGVARLALRPLRGHPGYGYWVLGTTAALTLLFELTFQPFAVAHELWSWSPAKLPYTWYGTPWVTFFGWVVSALVVLLCITPVLIKKSPVPRPPDYYPLWVWLLLKVLFATEAMEHHFRGAATVSTCEVIAVVTLVTYARHRVASPAGHSPE